jgi:hypothetical protein
MGGGRVNSSILRFCKKFVIIGQSNCKRCGWTNDGIPKYVLFVSGIQKLLSKWDFLNPLYLVLLSL